MRVPHIWPGFGQMWELTNAGVAALMVRENFRLPKAGQIWAPNVRGKETFHKPDNIAR
jgi:hypothetical protein